MLTCLQSTNQLCKNVSTINFDDIVKFCFTFLFKVYDGQDDSAALLGTYCGIQAPIKFRSTSNTLYVIFTSDGSVSGTGFEAGFSMADGKYIYYSEENQPIPLMTLLVYPNP